MRKLTKTIMVSVIMLMIVFSVCGCSDEDNVGESSTNTVSNSISQAETITAEEIGTKIVGEWGRLDEVMHYFNSDGSCIIGGMQGTYEITDDKSLVTYTMSGSKTVYEWAESYSKASSENYWYFTGDTFSVNGNVFSKISNNEYGATPDMP